MGPVPDFFLGLYGAQYWLNGLKFNAFKCVKDLDFKSRWENVLISLALLDSRYKSSHHLCLNLSRRAHLVEKKLTVRKPPTIWFLIKRCDEVTRMYFHACERRVGDATRDRESRKIVLNFIEQQWSSLIRVENAFRMLSYWGNIAGLHCHSIIYSIN